MEHIFFENWKSILRIVIITILAYVFMIYFLRSSGKRTLSKMNAFDFIVTVALGSSLATVILNKSVPLVEGLLAFFLLIYLQYLITYLSARNQTINNIVKSTPSLLVYKGEMLKKMMLKERISEDEIHAIVREKGLSSLNEVDAIVLETDGSLTLINEVVSLNTETMKKLKKSSLGEIKKTE